nr:hypothetical protein [Tanacetum cinerariifolium]
PRLEDTEDVILQKVLEASMTDAYPSHRGPLPPVVFREPDQGNGTESDEVNPAVIRSEYQEEDQDGSDPGKQAEGQAGPNPVIRSEYQEEDQARSDPGKQVEGQAGPNPGVIPEPQPLTNPG